MNEVSIIGLDLAKNVLQAHGCSASIRMRGFSPCLSRGTWRRGGWIGRVPAGLSASTRIFMSRSLRLGRGAKANLVEIAQVDDSKIPSQAGRRL